MLPVIFNTNRPGLVSTLAFNPGDTDCPLVSGTAGTANATYRILSPVLTGAQHSKLSQPARDVRLKLPSVLFCPAGTVRTNFIVQEDINTSSAYLVVNKLIVACDAGISATNYPYTIVLKSGTLTYKVYFKGHYYEVGTGVQSCGVAGGSGGYKPIFLKPTFLVSQIPITVASRHSTLTLTMDTSMSSGDPDNDVSDWGTGGRYTDTATVPGLIAPLRDCPNGRPMAVTLPNGSFVSETGSPSNSTLVAATFPSTTSIDGISTYKATGCSGDISIGNTSTWVFAPRSGTSPEIFRFESPIATTGTGVLWVYIQNDNTSYREIRLTTSITLAAGTTLSLRGNATVAAESTWGDKGMSHFLYVEAGATLPVSFASQAVLSGGGTLSGNLTVPTTATLAAGRKGSVEGAGTFNTLTISGNLTFNSGSTLYLCAASQTVMHRIAVTGQLSLPASGMTVRLAAGMSPGTYTILTFASRANGNTLPNPVSGTGFSSYIYNATNIQVVIV